MTLQEIIEQLESCHYECEAGTLENNAAFRKMKQVAELWEQRHEHYETVFMPMLEELLEAK
jgi:hypothetical protein